ADPVVEAARQIRVVTDIRDNAAITPELARGSIGRVIARLSQQQCQDLHRLQLETLINHHMTQSGLTRPEAINAIRQQSMALPDSPGAPSPDIIEECIADYLAPSPNSQPETTLEPDDSLQSDDYLRPDDNNAPRGDSPQPYGRIWIPLSPEDPGAADLDDS